MSSSNQDSSSFVSSSDKGSGSSGSYTSSSYYSSSDASHSKSGFGSSFPSLPSFSSHGDVTQRQGSARANNKYPERSVLDSPGALPMIEEETPNQTAGLDFTADPSRIELLNATPPPRIDPHDRPLPGQDFCVVNTPNTVVFKTEGFTYVSNDGSTPASLRPMMGMMQPSLARQQQHVGLRHHQPPPTHGYALGYNNQDW